MTTTKSKLMYRIFIYPNCSSVWDKLAILAAKHNGGCLQYSVTELAAIGKGLRSEYPELTKDTTIEPVGDNLLHIDTKVGETYQTVMRLELVEILEPLFSTDED